MELKSMKMSASAAKEYAGPASVSADVPRYPYGLSITLDHSSIEALGMTGMPVVGDTMMIHARVKVTRCEVSERQKEVEKNIGLQITDMALSPDAEKPGAESKLYAT